VWLALASFLQLLFMATGGTFVAEWFKQNRNEYLTVAALIIAIIVFVVGAAIYIQIFIEVRRHKK